LKRIAATMDEFHAKLAHMEQRIEAQLELPEEEERALEEQLKKLNFKEPDHVQRNGDSIEEINRNACVLKHLFQREADEIVSAILSSDDSRSKRQAFRNKRYPETVWRNDRVAFFFDKKASARVKTVFRKAAKLWRDNTCIDIFEDTCGDSEIFLGGNISTL
uniref:Astacin n=1 Tax=Heligmosomoides polygyrus TaxID=6339 RepID=A0A183FXW7_HELPZ